MKNKIMFMIAFILLLNVYSIMAVEYFQTKDNIGNLSTRIHTFVFYGNDFTTSHIKDNKPLELYVLYRVYIDTWNQKNIFNRVSYCNFTVYQSSSLYNFSSIIFNTMITNDLSDSKYFVKLEKGDSFSADMICKFESAQPITLEVPADFSIVSPSWECKACQYYEWVLTERKITKAENLGDKTVQVFDFIKKLFVLNYEILIALFWVLLIFLLLMGFGLIFMSIYFLFKYIWYMTK